MDERLFAECAAVCILAIFTNNFILISIRFDFLFYFLCAHIHINTHTKVCVHISHSSISNLFGLFENCCLTFLHGASLDREAFSVGERTLLNKLGCYGSTNVTAELYKHKAVF